MSEEIIAAAKVQIAADMGQLDDALKKMPGIVGDAVAQSAKKASILTDEIKKQKDAVNALAASLKAAGATNAGIKRDPGIITHITQLKELRAELAQTRTAQEKMARYGPTGGKTSGGAQAALGLSRMFEDVSTGGPLGGLNNVPEVIRGIGSAAGMSAAQLIPLVSGASGLATVGFLIYQNWDKLTALFGNGKIKTEAEQIEELGKKTGKTADEFDRLRRAKELESQVETNRSAKSESESDTQSGVSKAVVNFGQSSVEGIVKKHAAKEIEGMVGNEIQDVEDAKAGKVRTRREGGPDSVRDRRYMDINPVGHPNMTLEQLKEEKRKEDTIAAQEKLRAAKDAAAAKIVANAALDPNAHKHLIDITKKDASASALTEALEASTPEARTKKKIGDAFDVAYKGIKKGLIKQSLETPIEEDEARYNKFDADNERYRENKAERRDATKPFMDALSKGLNVHLLKGTGTADDARNMLVKAGVNPDLAEKIKGQAWDDLKRRSDAEVQKNALADGTTETKARDKMIRQAQLKDQFKPEVKSVASYLEGLQTAGLKKDGTVELLVESKKTNGFLKTMAAELPLIGSKKDKATYTSRRAPQ